MKEYSLTMAAQVETGKANKMRQRELENASKATTLASSNPSSNPNNSHSYRDELRRGLAEGLMYKQLQKVFICFERLVFL